MGWLSVTPEHASENRADLFGFVMPDLPVTETLQDCWELLGRCGRDLTPLTWAELQAFTALSGTHLIPPEARCLVEMSRAYCAELANTNPKQISPMERRA